MNNFQNFHRKRHFDCPNNSTNVVNRIFMIHSMNEMKIFYKYNFMNYSNLLERNKSERKNWGKRFEKLKLFQGIHIKHYWCLQNQQFGNKN